MQNLQVPIRPMPPQMSPQVQHQQGPHRQPSLLNSMPSSEGYSGQAGQPSTDIIFVPVSQAPTAISVGDKKKNSSGRWSDAETRYLLAVWKSRVPISKKCNLRVWESIAEEFNRKTADEGIATYRTYAQCKTRIKNLEDEFKRIVRDGKDKELFLYYSDFVEVMGTQSKEPLREPQPFQSSFDEDDDDDDDDDSSDDEDYDYSPLLSLSNRRRMHDYGPLTPQQCTQMMLRVQNQVPYDMRSSKRSGISQAAMHAASMAQDPNMMDLSQTAHAGMIAVPRNSSQSGHGSTRIRSSKWSDAETRYLLAIWKDRYPISKKRNHKVWESIAKEFNRHMVNQGIVLYRTGAQCKGRIKTLEDEFKRITTQGKKPESFEYYEDLREVFELHKAMSGLRYVANAGFDEDNGSDFHPGVSANHGQLPMQSATVTTVPVAIQTSNTAGNVPGMSSSKKRKASGNNETGQTKSKSREGKKAKSVDERGGAQDVLMAFLEESQKRDHEFLTQLSEMEAKRDKKNIELMTSMVKEITEMITGANKVKKDLQ